MPSLQITDNHDESPNPHAGHAVVDLLNRCHALWSELERFREHLKKERREQTVEISHYRGVVKSELQHLERLSKREQQATQQPADSDDEDRVPKHYIASSNLPFLEAIWNATKSSTGLQALQKRFYYGDVVEKGGIKRGQRSKKGRGQRNVNVRAGKALVDIVTSDGLEWIKVSLVTNHRMLMDKAREGWGGSSDEDSDASDDADSGIPLVRMAESLAEAAKEVRIRTKHPRIRLLLPKIVEGQEPEIDTILARLRALDIQIECDPNSVVARSLDSCMDTILTDQFKGLTETLNIDCTILLALVSDFSHCAVAAEPWFHRALQRQMEMEDKDNLLPTLIYPAVSGHKLVCSADAARRMREIVNTIGTPGERVRTALFLGDDEKLSEEQIRSELQDWSKFEVPSDLHLPVRVIAQPDDALPPITNIVRDSLTPFNQSVFFLGWATGYTTITSNRAVVKSIDSLLDAHAKSEDEWPRIWLCPTARSLVGKEKGRRE
ncbi:hypothetical protein MBLNU457_2190t1 [Dothideomycetes sp. NU457]